MKRGFLNTTKAQKEALYPIGPLTNCVPSPASNVAPALPSGHKPVGRQPYRKEENTALPASYTPTKFPVSEFPAAPSNHPANTLLLATIPMGFDRKPPNPDGHSEWIVRAPTMSKVFNAPGYPQPIPKPIGNIKSYTVKSTPTMGKGVFATRDIPMGGMIFAERPLLVVPTALIASPVVDIDESSLVEYAKVMMFQQEQRLEVAVGRMAPDRRAKLMALMNSHLEDGCGPITGIVRTNGYAVKNLWDGDGEHDEEDALHRRYYSAVCDVGSRINHSCRPNIDHEFHLSAFAMVFFAIRDVKAGEQLFYSYCSREHSASERKAVLAPYGITQCICAACVNATPETDALRQTFHARVQEYYMQRDSWPLLPKFPVEILNGLLRYRRALVKEGLDTVNIYWSVFLPTLITAYRMADRINEPEAKLVVQEMTRWLDFFESKQAMESSQ